MAHRRKIYIINPEFQLKFSLFVCLLIFASSLAYPYIIYDILSATSQFSVEKTQSFENFKLPLILTLALWQIGFCTLVFIFMIFLTHKVAGPMFKMKMWLQKVRSGVHVGRLSFRTGDYFQDIAEDVSDAVEILQDQHKQDFIYLSEVSSYLNNLQKSVPDDKRAIIEEITIKLDEIQNRFTASTEPFEVELEEATKN